MTGLILFFDLTDRKSFERLNKWLSEIAQLVYNMLPIILIGNKCDLADKRVVSYEEAEAFAKAEQPTYFETSAQSGENILEPLIALTTKIPQKQTNEVAIKNTGSFCQFRR